MKLTSNLLGELARASQLASPSVFETNIDVPPTLLPIAELRASLVSMQPSAGIVQSNTFITSLGQTIANAGNLSATFAQLGPGFWDLNFIATYSSNFLTVSGTGLLMTITIGTQIVNLYEAFTVTPGSVVIQRSFKVMLISTAGLTNTLFANGVGNNHSHSTSLIAQKLA